MSEQNKQEVDYKNLEEPLLTYVKGKLEGYAYTKDYTRLALQERKKWEKNPAGYDPELAPEKVRSTCRVSLENVNTGVSRELCQGVENLPLQDAMKICRLTNAPGSVKAIPFVESLAKKYDVGPEKGVSDSPKP